MGTFVDPLSFKTRNSPIILQKFGYFSCLSLVSVTTLLGMSSEAQAVSLVLDAIQFGNYNSVGTRNTSTYVTGKPAATGTAETNRSFFVFNIPAEMAAAYRTILNSQVSITNPAGGYVGPAGSSRNLNITQVTTANLLTAGNSTNIFADLGATGTDPNTGLANVVYRSTSVSTANNNSIINIDLLTNANNDIKAKAGATSGFAIGGALAPLSGTAQQSIFTGSSSTGVRRLTINYADAQAGTNGDQQFGNVLVGQNASRDLRVTNVGDAGSLLTGSIGASSNPLITPGSGTQSFIDLGKDQSSTRTFIFSPTQRGTAQTTITITSNTKNIITNPLFTGFGVAPVNSVSITGDGLRTNAGFVRIGTQAGLSFNVTNDGNGNLSNAGTISNLNGTVALTGSDAGFSGSGDALNPLSLPDNVAKTLNFLYSPPTHGPATQEVTLNFSNGSSDGRNLPQTQIVPLSAYGVGPEFESSVPVNSTLDFGTVDLGKRRILPLIITNATTDPTSEANLTGLNLLFASITGVHADAFSLLNFTPGTVILPGQSIELQVQFNGLSPEDFKQAALTFFTDQGVAAGQLGQQFSFNLQGNVVNVPEPNSIFALLTIISSGFFLPRNKRK